MNRKFDWIGKLKAYVESKPQRANQEIDNDTDHQFLQYMEQLQKIENDSDPSYQRIQRFFPKNHKIGHQLNIKIKNIARHNFLKEQLQEVLDQKDLDLLQFTFNQNLSPPFGSQKRLNYDSFSKVAANLPLKFKKFLRASSFISFDRDEYGRIDMESYFKAVIIKNDFLEARIQLCFYDSEGNGFLTEDNLTQYIQELIPVLSHLKYMRPEFKKEYLITATRRFFFFLDPSQRGKISIIELIKSTVFSQFFQLRKSYQKKDLSQNWFSIEHSTSIHRQFCRLDKDKNGLLKREILEKNSKGITSFCIERVFEEYVHTNNSLMDYKTYLDYKLALNNKQSPSGIQYFWRIFDVDKKGALDCFTINMFFRSVRQKLLNLDIHDYSTEDVKDEIFDMVKPRRPMAITCNDLIKCQQAGIKAFYYHDQRENSNVPNIDHYF